MAVSTVAAIRDNQISIIRSLTPRSHSGDKWQVALDERDFRAWAADHPLAAFRRYTIEEIPGARVHGEIINTTEWVQTDIEVIVAYPNDHRYGADNRRDQRDTIEQDIDDLLDKIGDVATGYTETVSVQMLDVDVEESNPVTFGVIRLRIGYHRTVRA